MAGGETLWITLQKGNNWLRFTIKYVENLYIYKYFTQLRHHQENTESI